MKISDMEFEVCHAGHYLHGLAIYIYLGTNSYVTRSHRYAEDIIVGIETEELYTMNSVRAYAFMMDEEVVE